MLLKSRRRMYGFKGLWRWTHHFPLIIWLSLLPTALGYFLGDTKAVLNGCEDHWTLQDRATVPQLYQMTVCFHIRVVVPGAWVAFSYSSVYAPRPDLGLEGDDGALYGWLLRVRHRFPVRLSPAQWHRVCLRRDVHGNSFSLEVDGKMVAERTAIAPAIPPAGSLWLGCRPRDQTPGANVGAVELYLFRMWADLGEHGRCEDGTVIGWNAEYWGVTSPKARQRDPNLMCDHRRLRREARVYGSITESSVGLSAPTASSPVTSTPDTQMNNQTSTLTDDGTPTNSTDLLSTAVPATTGTTHSQPVLVSPVTSDHTVAADAMSPPVTSPLSSDSSPAHQIPSAQVFSSTAPLANQTTPSGSANCDISQLCSNDTAYFWMSISVKDNGGNKTEQDVKDLVSHAFDCSGSSTGVCQGGNQLQVVEVSCGVKSNISNTTCSVLLLLSHAVLPCELQAAGVSALQQSQQIQATIIGAVERVGRTVCENVEPSGGGFVRCTSTQPLNDICQSNKQSTLTCTPIDSNPNPVPQPQPNTCSGETPLFCDCSAFCNSASQFFAMRIDIIKTSVDISYLQHLMSNLWQVAQCTSVSASTCEDYVKILNLYQAVHLECQGTGERLYSCMVIVEMSGLVNECSLSSLLQQLINGDPDITTDIALTRIMVCGPPGLSVSTLLASNLTWASSDLLSSDICSPDPTMFKCEPNQMLAVLLPNNCPLVPPTTNQTTTQRTKTNFTTPAEATPTSVTNNTTPIYTRAESTPVTPQTNASQGSAEPNMTTPLTTFNSTQSSTPQPLLQTSQNTTVIVSDSTIAQYTESDNTSLLTPTKTVLQDATTAQQNTTTHDTASPNSTTVYNVTTTDPFTPSSNEFKLYNVTTATLTSKTTGYNVSTVESFTPSQNDTTVYSVTTTGPLIPSANETKFHNVTTVAPFSNTTDYNVTSTEPLTPYPNVTTVKPFNNTTEYNVSTAEPLTPYPNVTTVYNVTTVTPFNNTTEYNVTTVTPFNNTTEYNVTTVTPFSNTTEYNVSTAEPFTPYTNITTVYNVTTVTPFNNTTEYNVTTVTPFNNTTEYNVTTVTPFNNTTEYNVTSVTPFSNTTEYNVTTVTPFSNTTEYNVSTAEPLTPYTNVTTVYNVTTVTPFNNTTEYNVTTVTPFSNTTEYNVTTVTPFNNTTEYNVTTVTPFSNTTEYNVTTVTPFNNTTEYNVTTVTPFSNTTEYNVTTVTPFSNTTEYNVSTAEPFTVYPNTTTVYNVTTVTPFNNTTEYNVTSTEPFTPYPNLTTVYNATTALGNYTTAYNATTTTNNNTTQEDVTAITESPNNITTTPLAETQQNTTVAYDNTSVSTTALQANETLTTASNMTMDNSTSDTDNATRPTTAPLNNQTVSVTYNCTTTANTTGPTSNTTVTANISPSVNATVSNLTTDLPLTTQQPGVNLTTTAANVSLEHITTTLPSSTTYGPVPTQVSTTAAEVPSTSTTPLQATTGTSTSTTVTSTGTTIGAQEQLANELLTKSQNASRLNSTEVTQLVDQLEKLLDGPSVSQTIGQKTINIISNLMNASPAALLASSNRITHMVDNLGVKVDVSGGTGVLSSSSLVLAVRTVDGSNFPEISVKIYNTDNVQLSAHSRSRFKRSGSAMGSVFLPSSLTSGLHPVQQQQANRVQFTFYSKSSFFQDSTLNNKTLVSPILSSSVSNLSISNLTNNIIFTIQNINPVNDNFTASCAFWDFTLNGGGGGWSSFGCFVVNVTAEETTCSCNHLTSFAILLDLSRAGIIDRQQGQILTFITYIGCGISAIFLAITLLTYLLFEKLMRDIPAKILVQLCISLLFLNLVFLLDGWLALYPAVGLCISTAFFLHYFLLTTFTWAGLEALHMYLSIVQVFTPYFSSYMLKFSLVGWGIPLLVVIIIISVDKNNYGLVTYGKYTDGTSDDFCWLRNDIAFYVGVVAYFLLIFVLCFVVFIVVMVQLSRIKKQNPHNQSPNRGVMTDLRSVAGLVVLLGLTWGFALFAWGPLYLPFVYLFTIFNSLQGFFIFVFHCAVKENVRRQWRTYLCCGKLRLAENSEWSRTATQNNRNTSVTTANTSAPQLTSRSSSVISDATNSSSSVFADSGISDGSNSDVVLNELHRRNLSQRGESI
ncbi:mucin-3A isoform X2 [Anabas testudineus]|uniref:mucin-3A isoform X2 n=1 Tax=Anabas testudineus TaxID=64144 RepID=UPI000E461F39|nr:mucin-3A isoform X2 [Anabas testudineus]